MNKEALNYFFKGYFHQDWFAEYGIFENAVRDFCDNESESRVTSVKIAIDELIAHGDVTEQMIYEFGGYVKPSALDFTPEEWLTKVVEIMGE
ncbi:MAG: contact-dependent growth inhibition system immunity protein [Candidatus Thiodiazotropha weberae]|nr:contact-dependent growth inhibition system immunity protein [Candidatus Thiodiazotropha endoloripes]MCG7897607.1 contact-dependent growth inhibition system immunity protein [Candidatus Thiodiazotropha weberae]MCG7900811.1 contact-dependent growth inhibition system immunity protein [Candidatus Thiodiazotropha weberae]MCG7914845.1 contact-dependent growth inhibition system immunity protein [Candidatus Thiodiazotropha weberae]